MSAGIRAGGAFVELFTKNAKLNKGLADAGKRVQDFGKSVVGMGLKIASIGAAGVAGFGFAAKQFADFGSALNDASLKTGATVEGLQELGFAAEQSGASMEDVVSAIGKMQRFLVDAASGGKEANAMLGALGVNVAALKALKSDQQFEVIAEALSRVGDDAQLTAAAMKIFGKGGAQLIPMIRDWKEGTAAARKELQALGGVMSSEDVAAADELGDSWSLLQKGFKATITTIGSALAPMLTSFAKTVAGIIGGVNKWISNNRQLIVSAFKIAAGITLAGTAIVALGVAIIGIGAVMTGLATIFAAIGSAVALIVSPIGLLIAGLAAAGVAFVKFTTVGQNALIGIMESVDELRSEFSAALGAMGQALAGGNIAAAAKVLWSLLKLEWTKGVAFLTAKWAEWKTAFLNFGTQAFYGLLLVANNVWASLQVAWTETIAFLQTGWLTFTNFFKSNWASAQGFVAKGILRLMKLFDKTIDVEAASKIINEDLQRDEQKRNKEAENRKGAIEATRKEKRAAIEAERGGAEQELLKAEQEAMAARQGGAADQIKAAEDALAAARAEFEAAVEEAKKTEAMFGEGAGKRRKRPGEEEEIDLEEKLKESKASVAGTFSAAVAGGLGGGGGIQQRMLKEQQAAKEQRAEQIKLQREQVRLLKAGAIGGGAFGQV